MLRRNLARVSPWSNQSICFFCRARAESKVAATRAFSATRLLPEKQTAAATSEEGPSLASEGTSAADKSEEDPKHSTRSKQPKRIRKGKNSDKQLINFHVSRSPDAPAPKRPVAKREKSSDAKRVKSSDATPEAEKLKAKTNKPQTWEKRGQLRKKLASDGYHPLSLKEAMHGEEGVGNASKQDQFQQLDIKTLEPEELTFEPVDVHIPPVPMLSYSLDRVLFNPGVYRLQDPRSRIYNFDPYLEKILPVNEFDFDALSEYKTSSQDDTLLDLTKQLGTRYTGSTSSMSSVLQHFHFLLSRFRDLSHTMLSRGFPDPSKNFSKITYGPDAIFLRYKDGIYAIDADKTFDTPNIMSWLGHSLEKLLTSDRKEFESFRRSSPETPSEDNSSRCYHYSKQGNILMRSQLDARDPRLPGTGVFDLKTRAVVSIRMNHKEYESGTGYQLRYAQGEWESFEREFYDMTRATMLKYSLQVRMGRMDGIFLAFHNIERIFGFQYLPLGEMDKVLHGQEDTCLGDQEFKLSVALLDELLGKATAMFPETTIRMHFESRNTKQPFMYVFAEPVTEEQADELQSKGEAAQKQFARTVVGLGKDQEEWQNIQNEVNEQVDEDKGGDPMEKDVEESAQEEDAAEAVEEPSSEVEEVVAGEADVEESADAVDVEESADEADAEEGIDEADAEESVEEGVDEGVDEAEAAESVDENEVNAGKTCASDAADRPTPSGPLMGWTLTTRSKINGGDVDRPENLTAEDEWQLQYHIQEIPEKSRWRLYEAVRGRRRALIGQEEQEVDKGLANYRNLIQRFSNKGKQWREEQDRLNEELGIRMYRPMGPGSEDAMSTITESTDTSAKTD